MHTIIISSHYSNDEEQHNYEVYLDAKTIKEIFPNYTEIVFPVEIPPNGVSFQQKEDMKTLAKKLNKKKETEVQLILNTHGVPGDNDIDNQIIIELIKQLVDKDIRIIDLCALMCDGFTRETIPYAEKRLGKVFSPNFGGMTLKLSSMKVLQKKLNTLKLKTEQNFTIRGFNKPYDPDKDKEDVINLLMGNTGLTLNVDTQELTPQVKKIENTRGFMEYVAHVNAKLIRRKTDDWTTATNFLGNIFKELLDEINTHINSFPRNKLSQASQALYDRIKEIAAPKNLLSANGEFIDNRTFLSQYRVWTETNLFKNTENNERLELIAIYCNSFTYEALSDEEFLVSNMKQSFFYNKVEPTNSTPLHSFKPLTS